ncbi:MAG: hypothetical protein OEY63_06765, partial [Gemmatimonadota bacterium]|nr:hypothetical protein [Gemmatimonadota bacterium]
MALSMIVNFTNPIVLAAGTICTWILVCVPFAFICRQINPGDRFADWEAYLIGQALGPVGLYLMKREL